MHARNLFRNGRFYLALALALGMWLPVQLSPVRLAAAGHPAPPPPAGDPLGLPPAADFNLPAPPRDAPPNILVERALQEQMAADETTGYLIYFREQADLSPAYAMDWEARGEFVLKTLQETAARTQADVRAYLEAQGADYQAFWVDNVIVVASANRRAFDGLLAFDAIQALGAQRVLHLDEPVAPPVNAPAAPTAVEPNISHVQAPAAWGLGYRGAGVVVANIDSGVRNTHAALVQQYRGASTGSHDYNWLGVAGGSATPNDDDGHGTHTMGTMVGADAGQVNQIGMAPGAQWIACDACEGGSCSIANLLTCGQWIVAPYPVGNPTSPDAGKRPHIVNNSWSGCENLYDNGYAGTITAWHAAGIYPIFSNGNAGNCGYAEPPGLNTVGNPARSGNVTGVGSTGQSDGQYAPHSNWGPTDHADTVNPRGYPYIKPQVVAPGVDIRSSTAGSDTAYQVQTGTSMAAPHVAGLVALMWEAGPCLIGDYAATETLLEQTANPIPYATGNGDEGPSNVPNHATGWGEIDAPAAVQAAAAYCHISGYGVLDGAITEDGTGTPIAGALVVAGNATRTLTLVTNAMGFYSDTLPSETYTLTVSAYGYAPTTLGGVTVISGATTTRDFVLTVAPQQILRVTPAGTTAWPCGYDSGWSNPCTLKTALVHATAGGEVWMAAGVYKPTNSTTDQEAYINIPTGVAVYGGFAGTETALEQRDPAANVTIFSGDIDNNDSQTPVVTDAFTVIGTDTNSYHVVAGATNDVTLDGVTITGGYGYYGCPHGWNAQYGGGLYTQGTMTLNNVVFSGNRSFYGGAIRTTARLTITNSTFTGNYAESSGGGISNGGIGTTLSNVTFTDNRADNGGGGAANNITYSGEPDGSMILEHVTFSDNHALNGGGLYVKGAAALTDVTFNHNSATNLGNAMTIVDASALVTLNRVTFVNNYGEAGGALSSWSGHAILDSVTFYGNTSKRSGGAMDVSSGGRWELNNVLITGNSSDSSGGGILTSSPMTLTNVTLVNNTANSTGSGIYNAGTSIVIRNSIIWGNTIAGGATISYSDVQGGWAGDGNLDADPVLAPLGDYGGGILSRAILTGSPAIDAGDPATCLATDMRGMARSSPCDMGAFELTLTGAVPTITLVSAPNPVAYGAPVTFTATVTAAGSTPGGAVQFTADGVPLGSPVTLLGDHASISTSSLSVGTRAIAATYTGDVSHTLATTQIQQTVSCLPAVSVTNANDDGAGSLRAAFAPLCAGGAITFDGDYTIVLAGPLTVDKSMTIDGAGRRITLSGNHATRIFNILGGNVILDHLTLADGQGLYNCGLWSDYCGGAIWMETSNVVLQNSTIVSSSAASRGGGIFNYQATLTVQNITLSGNAAGHAGGGIFSYFGTLNVANSTFSSNTAPDPDLNQGRGGGAIYNIGHLNLTNTILWGDTGAEFLGYIWSGGISYSILPGGYAGTGNLDADPLLGPLDDNGGETLTHALLPGSPALENGNPVTCLPADQRGVSRPQGAGCDIGAYEVEIAPSLLKSVTPTLDVPHHGVVTYTLTFSNPEALPGITWLTDTLPAEVDFGSWIENHDALVVNDQITWHGAVPAPSLTFVFTATHTGHTGDIVTNQAYFSNANANGWTFVAPATFTVVCDPTTTVQNANDSGPGSLRQAVASTCAGGRITFSDSASIYLDSELVIDKALTIDGSGQSITVSGDSGNDGSHNARVFNIASGSAVTLSHLSIVSGTHSTHGGGIYNAGDLTVRHCTIADNTSGDSGGGIQNWNTLRVYNSTLSGNTAQYGGGINNGNRNHLWLYNSTLTGNTGNAGEGGGIRQWNGTLYLYNTVLANNGVGGDCFVNDSNVILANVHNLVEDGSCSANGVGFLSSDPLLGPLADNGGGTLTHALLPGSPAIDSGDNAICPATDQRGRLRPQGAACDRGAYEIDPALYSLALTKSVTPTTDVPYSGMVTYILRLSNRSTADEFVWLTDTLPVQMDFGGWIAEDHGAQVLGDRITWQGTVLTTTDVTWIFTATHTGNDGGRVTNLAYFSGTTQAGQAQAVFSLVNVAPVLDALGDQVVDELTPLTLTATATDDGLPDGVLVFTLDTGSAGNITPGGDYTWTPMEADGPGVYTATVRVSDGDLDDAATFTITVNEVNAAPVAAEDAFNVGQDASLPVSPDAGGVLWNDTDAEGDALTVTLVSPPSHGSVVLSPDGSLVYTPTAGYTGTDSLTYRASDGVDWSNVATVTFTIRAPQTAVLTGAFAPTWWHAFPGLCGGVFITETGTISAITVTLRYGYPTALGDGLPRRYVVEVAGSGYTVALEQCYVESDLIAAGILSETALHAYHYEGGGDWVPHSRVDPDANTVTADNLVNLNGTWGLGVEADQPTPPPTYTLDARIDPAEGGSVDIDPDQTSYISGTEVTLTPQPAAGWYFTSWTGHLTGTLNPAQVTLDADKVITATFIDSSYWVYLPLVSRE